MLFYGYTSLPFLFHFLVVIGINYFLYLGVRKTNSKSLFILSIVLNIINLAFFKYFYFFTGMLFSFTGIEQFQVWKESIRIIFPMAISFYTFQIIAFQTDNYKGKISDPIGPIQFTTYLLFFPVLIAGPIMRFTDFFPHLNRIEPEERDTTNATYLMISGIIKKVLLADPLSGTVAPVYSNPEFYPAYAIFLTSFIYLIQLFFDFSGLTDMARGVGLYLGFPIPENFRAPFFSRSLSEFWDRWHITLSTWLRDYLFIPLGGSRVGKYRVYFNLILTMSLGGFWHGPDYTFLAWGAYWGIALSFERFLKEEYGLAMEAKNAFTSVIKASFVTTIAAISVLMFRANSTEGMIHIFSGLFTNTESMVQKEILSLGGSWITDSLGILGNTKPFYLKSLVNLETAGYSFVFFLIAHSFQYWPEKLEKFRKYDPYLVIGLGVLTVFLLTCLSQDGNDFIYYKF
ncbi:MAG: MBOAT family protein [Leptospiraceae bacterium]|nr:MBOAT family protein [Leptospiraceae bacterium]MCP5510320.1 MBOAT family protein [Leptospiraceae bacterium]